MTAGTLNILSMRGVPSRTSHVSFARILLLSPKRLNYTVLVTGTIKVHFTMHTTSVRKDIIVEKQMSVARLFSAT